MVLHNNKWDRKATRTYHRKHRNENETFPAGRGTSKAARGSTNGVDNDESGEEPEIEKIENSGTSERGRADEAKKEQSEDETTATVSGNFRRRKLHSNAWRYEESEEEGVEDEIEKEPEPDYIRMTAGKEKQIVVADDIDSLFSSTMATKGNVIKVEQKLFQDVNEKIAKQNAADSFRRRFGRPKGSSSAIHESEHDVEIDEFLGELKLRDKEVTGTGTAGITGPSGIRQTRAKVGKTNNPVDDEQWLDAMVQSRR